ncbi:long-chain-fatty-acid--CoA ligase [Chachezhania sediminis]|uniref:long-chain-fatty-acid--CoA ligase n=1 Tax=Chachezhania sediminis TaxID=2599291 RepID=UPI00131CE256|nr:long-chain-fatty-acid--CoA ligase [Chachezhania sediminis]
MYLTQSLRRMAQIAPDRLATVDGTDRRTWAQVTDRTARLAGGLAGLGVGQGDRVAILALNSARYMEAYFAIPWIGAAVVPFNTRWTLEELSYGLNDARPDVLMVDAQFLPMLPDLRRRYPGLRHVIFLNSSRAPDPGLPADVLDYEDLVARSRPAPVLPVPGETMAAICYTGGTTGLSKGVMLSHLAIWASSVALSTDYADLASEGTIFLHAMPLFHSGGSGVLFATTIAGGIHIFHPGFDPKAILQTIQDEKVTHTQLVPTMVRMVLDQPDFDSFDVSTLKTLIYGAAPMTQAQISETAAKLPHVGLQQGYGQTEMAPYISSLLPRHHKDPTKLRSAGVAGLCTDIIVADDAQRELPRGEVGEVLVRGPQMMLGYWEKPEETAKAMVGGWIRTGDAGFMDEDGFVFLIDRLKDMIVTGGENVYSTEVENAVALHPAVASCVVIGVPSDKWGEQVHAIVIARKDHAATPDEIIVHCRQHISGYKVPRSVEFRTDPFPVSGAGKILKREIRKLYWEGRETSLA